MALSPLTRPAESTQVLRYRGTVLVSGDNANVYPKLAVETPADSTIAGNNFTAWLRFPLFAPADPTDTRFALPLNVYDDGQPAGSAPHSSAACVASATPGVNVTDLSLDARAWAQNLEIQFNNIDTNVVFCDNAVSVDNDPANGAVVMLDNATTSGLGTGTGLPVVAVRFVVAKKGAALQTFNIDITFELRHSNHR